jgi:pyochelin synthetase
LFRTSRDAHHRAEILATARVQPAHHALIRRWLHVLLCEGLLAEDVSGRLRLTELVHPRSVSRAWDNVEELRTEEICPVEMLSYFQASAEQLSALMNGAPDGVSLRVLEVGASTGATTACVIPALSERAAGYLFTGTSQFLSNRTERMFRHHRWMRFGPVDVNADPRAQGLRPADIRGVDALRLGDKGKVDRARPRSRLSGPGAGHGAAFRSKGGPWPSPFRDGILT